MQGLQVWVRAAAGKVQEEGRDSGRKVERAWEEGKGRSMQKVTSWLLASMRSCLRLDAYTGLTSVIYMLSRSTVLMTYPKAVSRIV